MPVLSGFSEAHRFVNVNLRNAAQYKTECEDDFSA